MKKIKTEVEEKEIQEVDLNFENIRPQKLKDYIGQAHIRKNLSTAIKAAKMKGDILGHVFLSGPPGLGKTTLANIIANEMGSKIHFISGPAVEKQGELAAVLASLSKGDVLFIDEIHRIPRHIEEVLYSAMEDYKIDVLIGEGLQTKAITMPLERFTLIGATTKAGMISQPLRDRFFLSFSMEYYTDEELSTIIQRTSNIYGNELNKSETDIIAKMSRQTPRIANNITKRVLDYLLVNDVPNEEKYVKKALKEIGINEDGLNALDIKYLECMRIHKGETMGLKTLSMYLGETIDTITESIEPYLVRKGYIIITPRGRKLTDLSTKGE